MSKSWSEEQNAALLGDLFAFKTLGFTLLMIDAACDGGLVSVQYLLRKEDRIESVTANVPAGTSLASVTQVFAQGDWMQQEIAGRYPVTFRDTPSMADLSDSPTVEWGPFHPLLAQPVKFILGMKDERIESADLETGYNYRGLEELCTGRRPDDVLEVLERTSAINGFPLGLAFACAIEEIYRVQVLERAQWLRMLLMEMTFLHAGLQSLNQVARSLGLTACSARIFKLTAFYQEAAALLCTSPQFTGLLEVGGLNRDIPRERLFAVNAVIQEIEKNLKDIRRQWENTSFIEKRLHGTGKLSKAQAAMMTGRARRAAGFAEDLRSLSALPWNQLTYEVPLATGSDCFARAMLMIDDSLLSLDLIDQIIADLPGGSVKANLKAEGSGDIVVCEPEAYGGMAIRVRQEHGRLQSIRIRNSAALNISFLPGCLQGNEMNDLPLVVSSLELDLSAMEK